MKRLLVVLCLVAAPALAQDAKKPPEFVDGSKPFKHESRELKFLARVGKPKLQADREKLTVPGEECLVIDFKITNLSETKRFEYLTLSRSDIKVVDEFGNVYGQKYKSMTNLERIEAGLRNAFYPVGRTPVKKVDPGDSVQDILCFDKPIPKATEVRITVSGLHLETEKPLYVKLALPKRE